MLVLRQYFWPLDPTIAWLLVLPSLALISLLHLKYKDRASGSTGESKTAFGLLIILPFFLYYIQRGLIPDNSYDIVNYHLTLAQRSLGRKFVEGDFFPASVHLYSATPSMYFGVFRELLGYRLGTIGNLFIWIWTAICVGRILREWTESPWKRYFFTLLVLSSEVVLMEVHTYLVDLLSVPVLLEAYIIQRGFSGMRNKRYYSLLLFFLLGLAVSIKLSNLSFVIPIAGLFLHDRIRLKDFDAAVAPLCLSGFAAALLPNALFSHLSTGNPIYPFYNNIFKSPYFILSNYVDDRLGPHNLLEALTWPIKAFAIPERLTNLGFYSGRVSIAVLAAALLLVPRRKDTMVALWVLSALLWSIFVGYIRFGIFLEVLSGMVIIRLLTAQRENLPALLRAGRHIVALLFAVQISIAHVYQLNVSLVPSRPSIFQAPEAHIYNLRNLLRDRDMLDYQGEDVKELVGKVGAWLTCNNASAGYATLLKKDAPILNIFHPYIYSGTKAFEDFERKFESLHGRPKYVIFKGSDTEQLVKCKENIGRLRLAAKDVKVLELSFFGSQTTTLIMAEIEDPGRRTRNAMLR